MGSQPNKVPPDDWRRTGQKRYLVGVQLQRGPWRQHSPSWDHDHCEFCFNKFGKWDDCLHSGYSTLDDYRWICETCFEDFREEFNWSVLDPRC